MDARSPQLQPRTRASESGYRGMMDRAPDPTVYVRIKELTRFPGDQIFTAGGTQIEVVLVPDANYPYTLLTKLRGFRFVNVTGTVYADINGGGARQVFEKDAFDFVTVTSIRLIIPAAGSVTVQQWAE